MTEHGSTVTSRRRFYVPFVVGDLLLLGAAWLIFHQANRPMQPDEVAAMTTCVALGAILGVLPVWLQYRAEMRLYEVGVLKDTLAQVRNLEQVAERIATATGQWQTVQEHSVKTVNAAREAGERMAAESKAFSSFIEKSRNTEIAHLQLEVDKLRRAETEWLQVLVHVLDHVFALHSAALRSGQRGLIEQLTGFQNACRDVARRIGLVALVVAPGTPFDPKLHQLPEPDTEAPAGAVVAQTLATGYSFQGQLVRQALVVLESPGAAAPAVGEAGPGQPAASPAEAEPVASQPSSDASTTLSESVTTEPAPSAPAPEGQEQLGL
jgi:molecular chaperone GrpE (heat shock protein)